MEGMKPNNEHKPSRRDVLFGGAAMAGAAAAGAAADHFLEKPEAPELKIEAMPVDASIAKYVDELDTYFKGQGETYDLDDPTVEQATAIVDMTDGFLTAFKMDSGFNAIDQQPAAFSAYAIGAAAFEAYRRRDIDPRVPTILYKAWLMVSQKATTDAMAREIAQ